MKDRTVIWSKAGMACLQRPYVRFHVSAMTIGALGQNLLINNDRLTFHQARLDVAFVASNARMPALERQMRACVVVEGGGNPALFVMTISARRLFGFGELSRVNVLVACLANLRSALKLNRLFTHGDHVACPASDGTVRAKQRKLGL